MAVRSYQDLEVWQRAMELVEEVYRLTRTLPAAERYGMTSQMQRSAISIPANIAEGGARHHTREFLQHLAIAQGSLAELETFLLLTARLNYIEKMELNTAFDLCTQVGRMLHGLQKSLRRKLEAETP
jgi:four helix bundle protein